LPAGILYPLLRELPSNNGFIVHKAQLLNILNPKSSSAERRNFSVLGRISKTYSEYALPPGALLFVKHSY
jgi:hypothetical protein